jgi:t-SNARE complex subunit (syntaxin)
VAERPIDQLSLRDMFSNAEWLIRDLTEHLRQSFQTRARALDDLVRLDKTPAERDAITDTAVRAQAADLLKSDDYSQTLFEKLDRYLTAIDDRSHDALTGR